MSEICEIWACEADDEPWCGLLEALDRHSLLYVTDPAGLLLYVNARLCQVSGYQAEELRGHSVSLLYGGGRENDPANIRNGIIQYRHKNDGAYWLDVVTLSAGKDRTGRARSVHIAHEAAQPGAADFPAPSEIAQLKLHSRALQATTNGMLIADAQSADLPIVYVNPAFERITGYSSAEVLGLNCRFLQGDDRPQTALDALRGALRTRHSGKTVLRNYRKDGSLFYNEILVAPLKGPDGRVTHFAGVINDITARIETETELRESEQRYRGLVESQTECVVRMDHEGRFTFVNDAFCRLLGKSADALLGQSFLAFVHDNDRASAQANFRHLEQPPYRSAFELRTPTATGMRWLAWEHYAIKDTDAWITEIQGVARDVTERRQIEQESVAAKEAAERASRAKTEFLSRMSHELRTPLNAILGFAQVLEIQEQSLATDEQREAVKHILDAGWHLLSLIDEVLDLSKVENGQLMVNREPVPVATLLAECAAMVAPSASRHAVTISVGASWEDKVVWADRTRLKQALLTLLTNAVKYTREGGVIRLITEEQGDKHLLPICVHGTGQDITPERLTRIFEPFNRLAEETSGLDGVDLGLIVAKRLTELMGGTLEVTNRIGEGCEFCLKLPLVVEQDTADQQDDLPALPEADTLPATQTQHYYTILCIEDNPANLKLMEKIVAQRSEYTLYSAMTGAAGLKLAKEKCPDVILLDINLPDLTGYEVLAALQNDQRTARIPVIGVSAASMPHDVERGQDAGFHHYVTKPIDVVNFHATLDAVLAESAGEGFPGDG